MAAFINTNVASLNAQRNLTTSQSSLNTSLQRLSSGLRINSAKDDAAGLSISERFTAQIRGVDQARRNANDAISLSQTAEGALQATGDALQRIRELAVQAANSTNTASDRKTIQAEVGQLLSELDRVAQTTEFNGQKLLDGTFGTAQFQVGANANQTISAATGNFRTNTYGNNQYSSSAVAIVAGTADASVSGSWTKPTTTVYTAGSFDIAGLATGTVNVTATDTAKSVADKVNSVSSTTGVTATARTDAEVTFAANQTYTMQLVSDNLGATAATTSPANITFTVGANDANGLAAAVSAINDATSKTGVTAQLNANNNGIRLTNTNGSDIFVANASGAGADIGLSSVVASGNMATAETVSAATSLAGGAASTAYNAAAVKGNLLMNSNKGFAVVAGATPATDFAAGASYQNAVNTVDVSTASGANNAIKIIDSALAAVNAQRGTFGALQSRFSTAIANLQTTSENLSASRSRIQDADFAMETATLTRGQILQQAGTAMLAQANSLPNGVLTLLRG